MSVVVVIGGTRGTGHLVAQLLHRRGIAVQVSVARQRPPSIFCGGAFHTPGILMTADRFRKLALALPGAEESAHMSHPDYRVGGRIFATLGYPRPGWAAVMITPEDQAVLVGSQPKAFVPVKGKWGEQGATNIILRYASVPTVRDALEAAYEARMRKTAASRTAHRSARRAR